MYRIYSDSYLLHHDNLESLRILNPSVELELNKTGSFVFTVSADHPRLPFVKRMKSIIQVWQDDFLLFRGRVLDEEIGWHNERTFACEGDMAFLLDSIQRPTTFTGTVAEFVTFALGRHNDQVEAEKRFQVGSVTVNDTLTVDSTEYLNTLETLQKYLVEAFGGYLKTRQTNGINYIDYVSELSALSPQKITFGKNLLDMKRIRKGADIVSAIIPLGATIEDTEQRLTIAAVNGGLDYLADETTKAEYGFVVKQVIFDEITDATALKKAGQAHLAELVNQWETIELTAADMSAIDKDITSFHLGTQVQADSSPHGLNQRMLVTKLSLKLFEPWASSLTLGKTIKAFSEVVVFQKGDPGKPGQPGLPGQPGKDGKDGVNGRDGIDGVGVASITEQYYLSTSATALSGGSWSGTVPTWVDGRFMWTRSVIAYTNGTTANTNPKCVTGAKGSTGSAGDPGSNGKDGVSITKVDVMYYQSTSSTALVGGSWVTTAPTWVDGRFFWEKTVVTYSDGTKDESTPVCISGQRGSTGSKGDPGQPGSNGKDAAVHSLTAPSDTSYMWLDISLEPPILKRYDPEKAAWVIVNDTTDIVYNLEQNLLATIEVSEQNIQSIVSESYYLKDDTDALISSVSTEIEQTKNSVEIQFNQFSADIAAVANGTDAEFEEIRKYIRFVDGQILLGEVGKELELKIANDRISFLQDGAEVAYFSNRKLYVTDTQILHSLQLGSFAFMPRSNGNLSFKKIT